MNSSTGNSTSGDDQSDLFIGFPSVFRKSQNIRHNNMNDSQNELSDSRSAQSNGSTHSKASDTLRQSVYPVPLVANQINDSSSVKSNGSANSRVSFHSHRSSKSALSKIPKTDQRATMSVPQTDYEINRNKNLAIARRSSFDTISTKADSKVLSPYNIDTAGIRIGPPSESSESYSDTTEQSSHTSSNGCTKQRVNPSNIPISALPPRSPSRFDPNHTRSTTSITRSHHTSPKESDNLEGDFMGWGCGSESTYSENNSKKSTSSNPENASVNLNSSAVVYEDFPDRPRGDNMSVQSEPRSMRSIKVEDEFDSRRPWRKVPVEQTKEESTRSLSTSSNGSAISRRDGDGSHGSQPFGEVDQFRSAHMDMMSTDTGSGDYSRSESQSSYTSDGIQSSSTITELRIAKDALYYNRPDYSMQSLNYLSESLSVRKKEPFRPGPPLPHSGSIDSRDIHRSDHSESSRSYRSSEGSCSTQSLTRRDSETCSNRSGSSSRGGDDGSCSHQSGSRGDNASCCSSRSENKSIRDDDRVSDLNSEVALEARSIASNSSDGNSVDDTRSDVENQVSENARRNEIKQSTTHTSPLFDNSTDSDPHGSAGDVKSVKRGLKLSKKSKSFKSSPRNRNSALPQLDEMKPYSDGEVKQKLTLQNDFDNDGFADEIARARLSARDRRKLNASKGGSETEEQLITGGTYIEKKKTLFDKMRTYMIVVLIVFVIVAIVIYCFS